MVLDQRLSPFFNQTVSIAPFLSNDDFGKASYKVAVAYEAKIEQATLNIRTDFDREIKSTRLIYLNTTNTQISTKDLLTLPTGFEPINPLILAVRIVLDKNGISHMVLRTE
jgi:hypothetical protein